MKKSIFQFILILSVCCQFLDGNAQFITGGTFPFYGETDNTIPIDAIGIGNFTTPGATPNAALDIVVPYLSNNGLIYQGEAFRTKVDSRFDHTWKMWTFSETPKFFVLNPGAVLLPSHLAYDGSASVNDIHLNLKQKGNMNFFTYNTLRMRISEQGYLGISNTWLTYTPQSLLHLNQDNDADVFEQFTNKSTGYNDLLQGFKVGIHTVGGLTFAELRQQEDAPLLISTAAGTTLTERLRITYGLGGPNGYTNTTKVCIDYGSTYAPITQPQGMLNIGEPSALGSLGSRKWMNVGTYMVDASDQMYVGIKDDRGTGGADRGTAVINWGDNPTSGYGPDMLKFIFTSGLSTGSANDAEKEDGLEVARMTAYGNMGIGNIWNLTNILPKRRLDIWDNAGSPTSNPAHVNGPQLRLTETGSTTLTGGKWTDLETTGLGDFYIHPFDGTTNRNVGINTNIPGNTLEIKSNAGTAIPGSSGLRFTYLKTTSIPLVTNPFGSTTPAVLSVDNQGNVVLVKDETVSPTSGLNVCVSGIPDNYLLRMDVTGTNTVCKSQVYDDFTNSKVGIDDATPSYKLDVAGDFGINGPMFYNGARMLITEGPGGVGPMGSNLFLGINAGNIGTANTNYANTAMGVLAMTNLSSTAGYNTAMGCLALRNVTTGSGNTTVGSASGDRTTTGLNNVFVGNNSAINNQTGSSNVAIGVNTASDQVSGSGDIGNENVMIGTNSGGFFTTNANGNVAVGFSAGYFHQNGNNNIYIGRNANEDQYQNTNSFQNLVLIGENSMGQLVGSATTLTNAAAIGKDATVNCDNCIVLGDDANTRTLMGYNDIPTLSGGAIGNYRLYVNPIGSGRSAFFNGDCYNTGLYLPSDANLKTNIRPMQSADQILAALNPKTYYFDSTGRNARLNLPSGIQYGLLSTDVESVLPNLVAEQEAPATYDSLGNQLEPSFTFKSVNYIGLIPILIQKIKDQQQAIDSLTSNTSSRLNQLESAINACCNAAAERTSLNKIDIELSSENTIILNQNDPNPFAEQTRITFNVPTDVLDAKIIFFDNSGHVLQTVKINERGQGQINVYGEKLSSGIYSYSLIADGKVIDTKKMVCAK